MKKNTAVRHATPRHATPRHATPRHATPRHATPRQLIPHVASRGKHHLAHTLVPSHDTTRHDTTRHDTTRHDTTRHDTTRHDTTRHDTTRHDTTRHDNLIAHSASGGKFHFARILKPSYRTLLFLLAAGVFLFSCDEPKEIELSSEASLTSLTLTVGSTDHEVTFTGTQYTLKVGPVGTPIPAEVVVKEIVLSDGATSVDQGTQLSVTDNAVTLTVTAADGTTRKTYTVTLVFTTAGITSFTFEVLGNENMALDTADHKRIVGTIDQEAKTITFDRQSAYVYLDKLKATFEVSEAGAKVQVGNEDQTSGTTEQDFSASVSYEVSAEGTETTTYRVTLTKDTLATIENEQFRAKLKEFVPAAFTEDQLDITHDDVANEDGAWDLFNQTPKLTSVKGIEFFTALDTLYCHYNALTSLDMRKNTALTTLDCSGNNTLTSLDVSANTALGVLACYDNDLASLDVSANTALTQLNCKRNSLTSLDVSANTALTRLDCGSNGLTSLDVRANTALTSLWCNNNSLSSLDVSVNTALTNLNCSENDLTSLDVSANTALTYLECHNNRLTSLDMTGMRSVETLILGSGAGTDSEPNNHLLETLRVNTALQDRTEIVVMYNARGSALTITTVNDNGDVVCTNYSPERTTCDDN